MYVCQTEEKCGDLMFKRCFSVKLGNVMTYICQNIPVWIFDMTSSFSLCLPDVSSLPNLMVVIFFPAIYCCMCYILRPPFQFVFWYILWGDQARKRVFLRFRDTVFQSEERTEEEVWRHQEKSVNIFIELLLSFCAAKSYEFVSFIQKNNIT